MQTVIRKYDIHFHVDETVCGFGRTGHYWGVEAFDLTPDITTCAKALTAAFFPISAIMFRQDFFDDLMLSSDAPGVLGHGFTYAGHPVGAAVASEALKIYGDIDLIGHVRGIGLFCGIQLVQGKGTRALWDPALKVGTMVQNRAHTRGLYLRPVPPDRISFMPPLIINEDEIDEATAILKAALDDVRAEVKGRAWDLSRTRPSW
ncbi:MULTISPECIES: aminotransferase class III-fold pyridoxal phosphate-dependent enzyme [unclassified Ruegeria]|nr:MULTISPECIES: aminotransferase class III-fold pyridoxal phosphate-dependent enzyme [unclassified Ruegeria]